MDTDKQQALNAQTPGIYREKGYQQDTLWIRRMGGYELHRLRLVEPNLGGRVAAVELTAAFSTDGIYLGDSRMGRLLAKKYGLTHFERRLPNSNVASIGFNPKSRKWFGWSHRAIFGFGVGQLIRPGRLGSERIRKPRKIATLAEAKLCAKRFASAVS